MTTDTIYDLNDTIYNDRFAVGQLLKVRRETLGKTHVEIADELNYAYENFLSMVENGKVAIPLARLIDFVRVYDMPPHFALKVLKIEYPEYYELFFSLVNTNVKLANMKRNDADAEVERLYRFMLTDYKLDSRIPEERKKSEERKIRRIDRIAQRKQRKKDGTEEASEQEPK